MYIFLARVEINPSSFSDATIIAACFKWLGMEQTRGILCCIVSNHFLIVPGALMHLSTHQRALKV